MSTPEPPEPEEKQETLRPHPDLQDGPVHAPLLDLIQGAVSQDRKIESLWDVSKKRIAHYNDK